MKPVVALVLASVVVVLDLVAGCPAPVAHGEGEGEGAAGEGEGSAGEGEGAAGEGEGAAGEGEGAAGEGEGAAGEGEGEGAADDGVFGDDAATLARFEMNGSVHDDSHNHRDATLLGGDFEATAFGEGLLLGGGDPQGFDWSLYASLLVHPFTIELVLTQAALDTGRSKVLGVDDAADDGWYLEGARFDPLTTPVTIGVPHYLAMVSTSDAAMDVYVDGVLAGTTATGFTSPPASAIFFRDDTVTGRAEQFIGVVDAARFSSAARTAVEIDDVEARLEARRVSHLEAENGGTQQIYDLNLTAVFDDATPHVTITGNTLDDGQTLTIDVDAGAAGSFACGASPGTQVQLLFEGTTFGTTTDCTVTIDAFPAASGGHIEGTFVANLDDGTGNILPFTVGVIDVARP